MVYVIARHFGVPFAAVQKVLVHLSYIENGNVLHGVNFPSANKPRTDKIRTCVFATIAAKEYLENLPYDKVIGEKNGYVYAIIDAAEDIKSAADGIIRVRKIV